MPGPMGNDGQPLTRVAWYWILLQFALLRGRFPWDSLRLFYHAGLKHSLVFRGWRRFDSEKMLSFSARGKGGRKMQVFGRDNGSDVGTFEEFFSSRYKFLPPELPLFEPGVIYDLGANIGIASLYLACLYPKARFLGFEPIPDNFEVCVLNYRNLPDSKVFPWAIGARSEHSSFIFDENDLRGGTLKTSTQKEFASTIKRLEVQVYTVSDLITEKKLPPPDFVKIDVEGAELEVLHGLGVALKSLKRMIIETHGEELAIDCMKWALNHGFSIPHVHSLPGGFSSIWCDRYAP